MADKVYCMNCKHVVWSAGYGDLSRCGKSKKPDEEVDSPIIGPMTQKGEHIFCSFANKNHGCDMWEEETNGLVLYRRKKPALDFAVEVAKVMAPVLIPLVVLLLIILLSVIFGGA